MPSAVKAHTERVEHCSIVRADTTLGDAASGRGGATWLRSLDAPQRKKSARCRSLLRSRVVSSVCGEERFSGGIRGIGDDDMAGADPEKGRDLPG